MGKTSAARMSWLDANRVFAAAGVVLIHCSADSIGQIFPDVAATSRIGPVSLRAIAEFSGSELFFVFSLFLLALRTEQKTPSYSSVIATQAQKLLAPYLAWTLFYALFRVVKADVFGYYPALYTKLINPSIWIDQLLLGTTQYHLHFLPTLFMILLFYPVMTAAGRFPIVGLTIVPLIFVLADVQTYVWGHVHDPHLRDYLLRGIKIFCYIGYGFAAFALHGIWKRGLSEADWRKLRLMALTFVGFALLAKLPYYYDLILAGRWGVREPAANFAHFLLPLFVFGAFMTTASIAWWPQFSRLARYTFGVFLVHPIFIDLFDIGVKLGGVRINPTIEVISKWVIALPASFALAWLLSRAKPLAWLIGLGPFTLVPGHDTKARFRRLISEYAPSLKSGRGAL